MSNNRNLSENKFGNNVVVIQGDNKAPFNNGFSEEDGSWLEQISQTNPVHDKKRILGSKGPFFYESFRWILDNSDFNNWRNTEKSGVFWIKGDPGKGKTMLLGGIIDDFEENSGKATNLTYFFCQATDARINTADAVIGGLIVSFIKQHRELRSYVRTMYNDELDKLSGPNRWYILSDMFEKITQHPALPYCMCVVDALDECEQEHGREKLLKLIIETSCHVKWLISSRNITEIERELQGIESSRRLSLELKENAGYVTKSVDLYIDNSIQSIVALEDDDELLIKATNALKSKANGTFLWVALVIEELRNTKHRNVENVLNEIPEGLDNLYDLIWKRLAKQEDKDAYQVLLSIVTAAERPLRLEELLTFISSQWKRYKPTYTVRDIRDIVQDCGSFLSIRDNTVYFIHQSVKDYMTGTASRMVFPSGITYQHYEMFTTSLSAMSRILKHDIYDLKYSGSDIDEISPPNPDPLSPIAYCCVFWVEHLFRSCESGAFRDKVFLKDNKLLHYFLKVNYLCWLESLILLRSLIPQGMDAIQKLKNLLSDHYKSEANGHHVGEMTTAQEEREVNRLGVFLQNTYRFLHRCKDLYLETYFNYAYGFFYYYDDSHLKTFVNDAYQFFHHYKDRVRYYPLQLYHSAIIFENTQSAIYTTFHQRICAEFKNTITFVKMPQRRFSLLQNMKSNSRDSIIELLYSPDTSFLCSLSRDGTVSLYRTDVYTLERVIELDMDGKNNNRSYIDRPQHFLAFSIDSKQLVSISTSGIVQKWAVECGTQKQKLFLNLKTSTVPHPNPYNGRDVFQEEIIALSHYGNLAASTCRTLSGTVSSVNVWSIEAGECIYEIDQSHMPTVFHAAFSENSTMMALFSEKGTSVYSLQTAKEIKYISETERISLSSYKDMLQSRFSRDSKLLVLKYSLWDTCIWCTETWTMVRHIRREFTSRGAELSPNAAIFILYYENAILFESMDTGEPLLHIESYNVVAGLTLSPDWTESHTLASFSAQEVQIWRAHMNTRGKHSDIRRTGGPIKNLTISPKAKFLATCDHSGNIEIWNGKSGECIWILEGIAPVDMCHCRLLFSPNADMVACTHGYKGDVQVWNVETGKYLHLLKGPGSHQFDVPIAFSDDSRYIVTGYDAGHIKVWCVESGKCLYENQLEGGVWISRLAFSPGSKYVAVAFDIATCTWDWRTGHCISQIPWKPTLESLTFSLDATTLVAIHETRIPCVHTAEFYDVISGASLGHIDIGKSDCPPIFDPEKDRIVSDRFTFCKRSSWKHWDKITHAAYSFVRAYADSNSIDETWIYFGTKRAFQIPGQIQGTHIHIVDSLLAFFNSAGELFIIQLPGQWNA